MKYNYSADEEEDLKFRYLLTHNLDATQDIIKLIKAKTSPIDLDKALRYYLLQNLVVAYMRPFLNSRGRKLETAEVKTHKGRSMRVYGEGEFRVHRISSKNYVPVAFEELHRRLEVFRSQQFAHTDLTHFRIQIANFGTIEDPRWIFGFKGHELEYLDQQFLRIEELVTIIQKKVQAELQAELEVLKTRGVVEPVLGAAPTPKA